MARTRGLDFYPKCNAESLEGSNGRVASVHICLTSLSGCCVEGRFGPGKQAGWEARMNTAPSSCNSTSTHSLIAVSTSSQQP